MIKITVFYPATPPAESDIVVFSAEQIGDDDVVTDLCEAVSLVEQEISNREGIFGVDASDDDTGDISVFFDPKVAPWQDWYQDALHGIWIYYHATLRRAFDFEHETQASNDL